MTDIDIAELWWAEEIIFSMHFMSIDHTQSALPCPGAGLVHQGRRR
ncbi:MAG: hypothetical protein P1P72_03420 [ANME-2 cluster archaeon]|nr:hypothetical protein [ANME-2 cluster archaeon]